MWRFFVGICLSLMFVSNSASAALVLSLEGAPSNYVPGDSFSFLVKLSGAEDLNLFGVDLVLTADQGVAGTDFFFQSALQPVAGYVFDVPGVNPVGLFANTFELGNSSYLSLSDFLDFDESVTTVAGVNDVVAVVTVATTSNVGGLKLAFDTEFLFLDSPDGDVDGYDDLVAQLASATPISISPSSVNPIPEPSTWTMALLLGTLIVGGRRLGLGPSSGLDSPCWT